VVESAHPYANNFDYTWTIHKDGATQIKVYFSKIETEANYDHLYVMDGSNNVVYDISDHTNYLNGATTGWITGDTVKLRLDTDYSVTKYGFRVYQIEFEAGSGGGEEPTNGDMDTGADAYNSYGASDSATTLSTPISGSGTIDIDGDQYDQYKVAVDSGDEVTITYSGPGSGIDVPIYDTDKSAFMTKSNTNSFTETVTASGNGYVYLTIDADASDDVGTYTLDISVAGAVADTTAPSVSITSPSNGATVSGSISVSVSSSDNVGVVDEAISIDGGSYTTSMTWDTTTVADGEHTIRARAWDAAGNYGYSATILVNVENNAGGGGDFVLTDGVTSSGTLSSSSDTNVWTIEVADNAESMYSVMTCGSADFDLYGRFGAEPTTSTYDWRGYTGGGEEVTHDAPSAGTWYIMVNVYSGAPADYDLTVSITYGSSGGGGGNVLTDGVTSSGSIASENGEEMWTMEVGANMASMRSVLTCGSSDFDLYGRFGAEPTTSTYDWRGYTSGGEDVTFNTPSAGTWYIMVRSYSGTGAYDLTVTLTENSGGGGSTSWGTGGKYAIMVGISDYQSISDLNYCDEDAYDWYNFMDGKGYESHVYGDGHTSNYPVYNGDATEANVRAAIQELAGHVQAGDEVVITTSGHGASPDTSGWNYDSVTGVNNDVSAYLCMYDCSGSTGCYYDYEIAADFNLFPSGVSITFVIDHCHSGGIGPEIAASNNAANILTVTTCSGYGYGYDEPSHNNGKFTYWMLEGFAAGQTSFEGAFNWLMNSGRYLPVSNDGDLPQIFDGNTGSNVYP
jgi:hypothetical protein